MLKAFSLPDARDMVVRVLVLTLVASAMGVFHVSTTKASDPTATPPCYDIIGQGKAVPVSGVNNSGVVSFDPSGGNPAFQYEACAEDPDGDPTVGNFELRGWAWDDNLGWISLYCGDEGGGGYTNLGIPCGTIQYGVQIDTSGNFSGYAWGDNTGWISFNNPGFSQVKVDATNPTCQGYVYADTDAPDPSCPAHTKADTAAWSDNVGWFDFDGIIIPWYSLIAEITDAGIHVTLTPDPATVDATNAPVANGSDRYTLNVNVVDKSANPVGLPRYTVTATPNWFTDTVKKDQTIGAQILDPGVPCPGSPLPQNAVTKPCGVLSDVGSGNYQGNITSVAPTSNMNGWDKGSDGTVDFPYETFVLPASLQSASATLQSNDIGIYGVTVAVIDNNAGGACAYGFGPSGTCPGTLKYLPSYPVALKFRPHTNVTTFQDPNGNDQFIDISGGGIPQNFPITISGPGSVTFTSGIDPSSPDYSFIFDSDSDGLLVLGTDNNTLNVNSSYPSLPAGIGVLDSNNPPPQLIPGEYMYSVVNDGGGVQYYSNKLPKNIGSIAAVPIAVLRGNVYSTGAAASTSNQQQAVTSLGDVSTNILRDTIFRNVSSIIAGATAPGTGSATVSYGNTSCNAGGFCETTAPTKVGQSLLPGSSGTYGVLYFKGDVHINTGVSGLSSLFWCGQTAIVDIGGNVYIDSDVYNNPALSATNCPDTTQPRLGIIALKDLAASAADQGNVYINPGVSAVQANIFADGSVFSYSPGEGVNSSSGEPVFSSVNDAENTLKTHQLYIDGSLASQNTIGGSSLSQPITGNGRPTTDLLQARLYDLNYLRYYTGVLKRGPTNIPIRGDGYVPASDAEISLVHTDGTPWTAYETPPGYLYAPQEVDPTVVPLGDLLPSLFDPKKDLGATYIYFDPPPSTLPGFSAVSGGTQRQLTQ